MNKSLLSLLVVTLCIAYAAAQGRPYDNLYTLQYPTTYSHSFQIRNALAIGTSGTYGSFIYKYYVSPTPGSHPKFQVLLVNQTNWNAWATGSNYYTCLNGNQCTISDDWSKSYEWSAYIPNYETFYIIIVNKNFSKNAKVDISLSVQPFNGNEGENKIEIVQEPLKNLE
eukprot:TRINITY_DN2802_c0_g1_i1.p1 TRINITY_DN2802_c0_g1~~TRINITY_DN2802_c0_g1_i1.p1  ORF type:complete len:169 (+),score=30.14 TRINITY_DN2802_c0_g1_i1:410-916(+)